MIIDHVVLVVPDAAQAAVNLREQYGLGSERGPFLPLAGTQHYNVPLRPPAYLEFVTIDDRATAATTEAGQRVLACEAAGFGLLGWSVLVEDLEAVSERLDIEIFDYTISHADGTLRGWRAVSGPAHLPYFIDYPRNGNRLERWQAMYERVGHTSSPGGFSELTLCGSESELHDWLGPHKLPLRFVDGPPGIRAARISTAAGDAVIS